MTNHTSSSLLYALAMVTVCSGACSWTPKGDAAFDVGIKERGVASWYGEQFHGRQAANGELFDMEALTAAHRTLPLGSIVRVVNLENGRHLHVRITDRGPYVNGRILDLSHAAAVQLGMDHGGLAHVQIAIVGERRPELVPYKEGGRSLALRLHQNATGDRLPPVMSSSLRILPSDLWFTRRIRRVPAILDADHTAHAGVATLALV